MTRFGFALAKLTRNEMALQAMSTPLGDALAGRSVALIGNARSLSGTTYGAEIDANDIVIRLNGAPIPTPQSHGRRTDWMAISTPVPRSLVAERYPDRILWMTGKRKRLPYWLARDPRFYLNTVEDIARLKANLSPRPTTGAMVADLVLRSDAARLSLYGFDFFASLSLSGNRRADQVAHDFAREKAWFEDVIAKDPRITLFSAPST